MHNITAPATDDASIESELQALGKTAPRVTRDAIEANILECHYFTADDGVYGAGISEMSTLRDRPSLRTLTICVLVLRNGFTVTGESACASAENFDAAIGQKIARDKAIDKCWPLMGYALKQQLHEQSQQT